MKYMKTKQKLPGNENAHSGHRQRLRNRFVMEGLDSWEDHNILELVLFYALPRGDTNELAHDLIDTFGSFSGVIDAELSQLQEVSGIGRNSAILLKMIPQLCRRYMMEKSISSLVMDRPEKIADYLSSYYVGKNAEEYSVICLDAQRRMTAHKSLGTGDASRVQFSLRKVLEFVLAHHAVYAILAHNHPGGAPIPSDADLSITAYAAEYLSHVGITLSDHIIVGNKGYLSFAESGQLQECRRNVMS